VRAVEGGGETGAALLAARRIGVGKGEEGGAAGGKRLIFKHVGQKGQDRFPGVFKRALLQETEKGLRWKQ